MEEQSVPTMSYSGPKGDTLFVPTVPCSTSAAPGRGEVLEALFTMLPQPMCVFDDRRQLLIANPASAALVGYRVEQLVGEFEWLLLPSDTPRWRRFLRDMHGTNAPRSTFFRLRHRSGDWLWAHAAAAEFTVGCAPLIAVTWKDCSTDLCEDPRTISPAV